MARGDKQQAGRVFEESLQLNPQNENAKKMPKSLRAE